MKIWVAELVLMYDCRETKTKFYFDQEENEYEENKSFPELEWVYYKSYMVDKIPKQMTISEYYGNFRVTQGFDRELNGGELKEIEDNMRKFLIDYLKKKKKEAIKMIDIKIKALEES